MTRKSNKSSKFNSMKYVPCRYFLMGQCEKGNNCEYAHDTDKPVHILENGPPICAFYLKGHCIYGEECKFRHLSKNQVKTEENNKSSSSTINTNTAVGLEPHIKSFNPLEDKNTSINANASNELKINPFQIKRSKVPNSFADAVGNSNLNSKNSNSSISNTLADSNSTKLNINAAVFVPSFTLPSTSYIVDALPSSSLPVKFDDFCPEHVDSGYCSFQNDPNNECPYTKHGTQCPICTLYLIDQNNEKCNHLNFCNKKYEKEILENCKIQDSEKLICSICLDIVWDKPNSTLTRFGILENCDHIFCLACIREWRKSKQAEISAIRGCPTCRKHSYFIIPSKYFIKDTQEKEELIKNYKSALSNTNCKHFKKGKGDCPFGTSCFYKHMNEDGTLQDRSVQDWKSARFNQNGERVLLDSNHPLHDMLRQHLETLDITANSIFLGEDRDDYNNLLSELMANLDFETFQDDFFLSSGSENDYYSDPQLDSWIEHGDNWTNFL